MSLECPYLPVQVRPDPALKDGGLLEVQLVVHAVLPQDEADGVEGHGGVEEVECGQGVRRLRDDDDMWVLVGERVSMYGGLRLTMVPIRFLSFVYLGIALGKVIELPAEGRRSEDRAEQGARLIQVIG